MEMEGGRGVAGSQSGRGSWEELKLKPGVLGSATGQMVGSFSGRGSQEKPILQARRRC